MYYAILDPYGNLVAESSGLASSLVLEMSPSEYLNIFQQKNAYGQFVSKGQENIIYLMKLSPNFLLMIQTQPIPLSSMTLTLKVQAFLLTLFFLLIATLLSRSIYKKITKPMIELNDKAKILSQGDYSQAFLAQGYTEIEELSSSLNQARHDLQIVEKERNELLANISHDLKTPLTMIQGYTELMLWMPEERKEANLSIIYEESKHLESLINQVLDLNHAKDHHQKEIIDLIGLLKTIIKHFQIHNEKITLKSDYKTLNYEINLHRFKQVIYNLISNSLNHNPKDTNIILQVKKVEERIKIAVIDDGNGIPEEQLEHIWERYYQSNHDHQRSHYGSGIELSIVKEFLEEEHYEYGVKSTLNKGSEFYFYLKTEH